MDSGARCRRQHRLHLLCAAVCQRSHARHHDIEIGTVRLLRKTGGKRDFQRTPRMKK
jgi:hypothetical protein